MAELYNRQPGPPHVLIGNWVEDRIYWDAKKAYEERMSSGDAPREPACPTIELQAGSLFLDMELSTTNGDYGDFRKENRPVYAKPMYNNQTLTAAQLRLAEKEFNSSILNQTAGHDILNRTLPKQASADPLSTTSGTVYLRDELAQRPREPLFEEHLRLYNTSRQLSRGEQCD